MVVFCLLRLGRRGKGGLLVDAVVLRVDVLDVALGVMRHRLVLSYEALSDNITGDDVLNKILSRIPIPEVPLHEHTNARAHA